jgi:hypothetical protein
MLPYTFPYNLYTFLYMHGLPVVMLDNVTYFKKAYLVHSFPALP